jgi:hypothetical protein
LRSLPAKRPRTASGSWIRETRKAASPLWRPGSQESAAQAAANRGEGAEQVRDGHRDRGPPSGLEDVEVFDALQGLASGVDGDGVAAGGRA